VWLRLYQSDIGQEPPSGRVIRCGGHGVDPSGRLTYHAARAMLVRARPTLGATGRCTTSGTRAAYRMARDPQLPFGRCGSGCSARSFVDDAAVPDIRCLAM